MAEIAGDTPGEFILGPIEAAADPAEIAAFRAALGSTAPEPPPTYPIVWLARPALRAALDRALGGRFLPIHESQSFDYERPLKAGGRYVLTGVARRESAPDRLILTAEAQEADGGAMAVRLRSVLRLVEIAGNEKK
ncbi:MAG: hypothetical protein KGM42_05245 [Hyphomicrobiales bacterium]|nr:hypothetical protein [Hyphomicrobiales bacterium]